MPIITKAIPTVVSVQVSIWIKCPHCQAQFDEVVSREAVEPCFRALKNGLTKSIVKCPKCEHGFGVEIANL
jgi:uncharacterized C2H2 Zn-finger protein